LSYDTIKWIYHFYFYVCLYPLAHCATLYLHTWKEIGIRCGKLHRNPFKLTVEIFVFFELPKFHTVTIQAFVIIPKVYLKKIYINSFTQSTLQGVSIAVPVLLLVAWLWRLFSHSKFVSNCWYLRSSLVGQFQNLHSFAPSRGRVLDHAYLYFILSLIVSYVLMVSWRSVRICIAHWECLDGVECGRTFCFSLTRCCIFVVVYFFLCFRFLGLLPRHVW